MENKSAHILLAEREVRIEPRSHPRYARRSSSPIKSKTFAEAEDWEGSTQDHGPLLHQSLPSEGSLSGETPPGWYPYYLRIGFLLSFAIAYLILASLLAALYYYSQKNQGLTKDGQNWHYIFRYGPTAVLTIFAAFWNLVEYRLKVLAPWYAMSKGPVSAEKSVLLDYLSPSNPRLLPRALRAGHYIVALGIIGSLLIKLLIVVSTGLFVSQETIFERQSLAPTNSFAVPENFNGSIADTRPRLNVESTTNGQSSYPFGSTSEQAFQPFAAPAGVTLAQRAVFASVDIFSSDFDCHTSQLSSFSNGNGRASVPSCNVTWTSDGQQVNGHTLLMQTTSCDTADGVPQSGDDTQRYLVCAMDAKTEDDHLSYDNESEPTAAFQSKEEDSSIRRLVKRPDFGSAGAGPGLTIRADPITCLICSPSYSILTGNVSLDGQTVESITTLQNADSRQITNLSSWQMAVSVFSSLGVAPGINFLGYELLELGQGNFLFEDLLPEVAPVANNFTALFDADTLRNASTATWKRLAAQIALLYYMSPTKDSQVQVNYDVVESRMCVQTAVLIVMEIILTVLAITSLLLAFLARPRDVVPANPNTILGLAAITAKSPEFASLLSETGNLNQEGLNKRLVGSQFATSYTDQRHSKTFKIHTPSINHDEDRVADSPSCRPDRRVVTWVPFPMKHLGYILLCGVPIATISILAGLLAKSKKTQGIAQLPLDVSKVHYAWTLLPAAVLLGIGSLFKKLDASVRDLQPYHDLCYGRQAQRYSALFKDYGSMLAIQGPWDASKGRQFAMLAATLGTLSVPFLPIVVSGLFSPDPNILQHREATAKTVGWFNSTNTSLTQIVNDTDPYMISRIMWLNASFPQWTYSELAIAEIGLDANETVDTEGQNGTYPSHIDVQVPAVRPVMNCTNQPYRSAASIPARAVQGPMYLQVNLSFPETCAKTLLLEQNNVWSYTGGTLVTQWYTEPGIFGYWSPAYFGPAPCPTTMGIFGERDDEGRPLNLTMLTCMPYMESIQANATFSLPSFNLTSPANGGSPIVPIESTAQFFNNDSYFAMHQATIDGGTFDDNLVSVNLSSPSPLSSSDSFFQALFQGIDAVPDPHALLGPAGIPKLIDAVEHLYRLITVQSLNSVRERRVSSVGAAPQPASAVISFTGIHRLQQSATATYILIALLALMLACAVVVMFTFKPEGLLSKAPHSIAARAGLLAGGNLLELMPKGAEWPSEKEVVESGVLEGTVLRLEWWRMEGSDRLRYGIVAVADGSSVVI